MIGKADLPFSDKGEFAPQIVVAKGFVCCHDTQHPGSPLSAESLNIVIDGRKNLFFKLWSIHMTTTNFFFDIEVYWRFVIRKRIVVIVDTMKKRELSCCFHRANIEVGITSI